MGEGSRGREVESGFRRRTDGLPFLLLVPFFCLLREHEARALARSKHVSAAVPVNEVSSLIVLLNPRSRTQLPDRRASPRLFTVVELPGNQTKDFGSRETQEKGSDQLQRDGEGGRDGRCQSGRGRVVVDRVVSTSLSFSFFPSTET